MSRLQQFLLSLGLALSLGTGLAAAETTTPAPDKPAASKAAKDPVLEGMRPCESGDDAAARAVACTALINGGTLRGKALGAAYLFRGQAQADRNEMKAALSDFSEALKVNPQATDALYSRGVTYALMGQTTYALSDFAHLLDLAPNDPDTLYYRARIYMSQGKNEAALDDLSAVLKQRPEDVPSRLQRAGISIMLQRNEDAIADLNQLLKKDPTAPGALYNRGRAAQLEGDYAAAARDFSTAMVNRQSNPYAALRLYIVQARSGKKEAKPLDSAAKAFPADQWPLPIVAFYQGKMSEDDLLSMTRVGNPQTAITLSAESQYYLGQWALLQDDKKAAQKHFEAALATKAGPENLEFVDAGLELKRLAKKKN